MPTSARRVGRGLADRAGDLIPFGDPYWYQDWASPYYNASHRKLRKFMRELVEEEVIPNISEWEADKKRTSCALDRADRQCRPSSSTRWAPRASSPAFVRAAPARA